MKEGSSSFFEKKEPKKLLLLGAAGTSPSIHSAVPGARIYAH
jgi:hypothetical protein